VEIAEGFALEGGRFAAKAVGSDVTTGFEHIRYSYSPPGGILGRSVVL
jgi:hypothetical protein